MTGLLLAQAVPAGGTSNTAEVILFSVFSVIALGAGIAVITMRNIVHAALMLVINMLAIAGLYLTLQSGFLTIVQIIVYAGAIMVLFLFVIMLLGVDRDDLLVDTSRWHRAAAGLGTVAIAGLLLYGFAGTYTGAESRCGDQAATRTAEDTGLRCVGMDAAIASNDNGSVGVIADSLFGRYTFPFEISALLLTVATIGAMLLGRRTDLDEDDDPAYEPSSQVPGPAEAAALSAAAADNADELTWDMPEIDDGPVPPRDVPDSSDTDSSDLESSFDDTAGDLLIGDDPHILVVDGDDHDDGPDPSTLTEEGDR